MNRLSISNIAWDNFDLIYPILKKYNIEEIEIAPTKINGSWSISDEDIYCFKKQLKDVTIYSMQSLNYNSPYNVFIQTNEFVEHIKNVIILGSKLGAKVLVFGSPKARFLSDEKSEDIFLNVLHTIGDFCKKYDIKFCIEPNAKVYGCNFITSSIEAIKIIEKINHSHIGLHLDTACMTLENDFISYKPYHFHVSEPYLSNFENPLCNHVGFSDSLKKIGYKNKLTIEMKNTSIDNIEKAILFATKTYSQ